VTEDPRPVPKGPLNTGAVIELIVEKKSLEEIDRGREERKRRS
jgi:hypothetical protein